MEKKKMRLSTLIAVFLCFVPLFGQGAKFTLVIDAGHGGHDAGAIGTYSKEKNINLNVALAFGHLVETQCPDVHVIYTRKTDVFIPLDERARIANKQKANLFISIHTNALPNGRIAYGAETYTLGMARAASNLEVAKRENSVILVEDNYKERYSGFNPNSAESYIIFEFMQDQFMKQSVSLATHIQKQYVRTAGRNDKGVYQAGFLVLRNTSMPSVLTELGFISTPEEERFLNSEEGIRKMSQSIFQGFVNYRREQEGKVEYIAQNTDRIETVSPPVDEKQKVNVKKEDEEKPESLSVKKPEVRQDAGEIIFKIQLLTSSRRLRTDSHQFKSLHPIDCYVENNIYKYIYGSSSDYVEIQALRKSVLDKFPDAFIVAFKQNVRMDLNQAIRESRKSKTKK